MNKTEHEASEKYHDANERDITVKQTEWVTASSAFDDSDIDESKVQVLPGTGGPDEVGDTEAEIGDYNRSVTDGAYKMSSLLVRGRAHAPSGSRRENWNRSTREGPRRSCHWL